MTSDTRVGPIVAAALVAVVLRLAFGFGYWHGKPLTHDEREYLTLARSLTEGRGFSYDEGAAAGTSPQFGRAPGYPVFLSLIGAGRANAEETPAPVKIAQSLLGGVIVFVIGLIAAKSAGSRAGALAALIAAVYPSLVWTPSYVFSETLFGALALIAVLVLQPAASSRIGRVNSLTAMFATAGILIGLSILVRPAMLLFVPLVALWIARRRGLGPAILVVGLAALTVAPWTIRNLRTYDRFVLVASEGGVTFWTGNHPLARGEGDLAANPEIKRAEIEFRQAHPGLSAEELEPLYYADAMHFITSHPLQWLGLLGRKLFYTVVPIGPSYTLHSGRYLIGSVVPYLVLLPLAIAGLARLARTGGAPAPLLLLASSVVLVGLIFFPQERFRIPVIDPTLIVCAAALGAGDRFER